MPHCVRVSLNICRQNTYLLLCIYITMLLSMFSFSQQIFIQKSYCSHHFQDLKFRNTTTNKVFRNVICIHIVTTIKISRKKQSDCDMHMGIFRVRSQILKKFQKQRNSHIFFSSLWLRCVTRANIRS